MSKIGVCIKCLVEKKIQARGMCANCYRLETAPIGECIVCGKIRQLRSKSTCGSCYIKIRLAENPDKKMARSLYIKEYFSREENKDKEKERSKRRYSDPDYVKKVKKSEFLRRISKYGLTEDMYLKECENECKICGSKERLHVDHCHNTGLFRGILCGKCNQGLGLFDDNSNKLELAIKYLNKFEK